MSTQKHIDKICVAAVLLAMIIAAVFMNGEKIGIETLANEDRETYEATEHFTSNDLNSGEMDFSDAVKITLNGDTASIQGNGAYVLYNTVRIVKSGYYSISGASDQLQIVVEAEDYSKVWIELNGVTLSCGDDACLQVEKADKVFLVLAEGTENTLSSGSEYSEDAVSAGHDGALFARDDITITGSGSLSVTSGYKHGIVSNDELVITGGTIDIKAASDGLHANDGICICNASLSIEAGDEGIQTDEAESEVYIESGTIRISSTGDSIKSAGDLSIQGGEFTIDSEDDAIHSDTTAFIYGGTITIRTCYEGIEAQNVEIHGGDITICPEDDGINANGGSGDLFGMNFGGGPGGFAKPDGESTDAPAAESGSAPTGDPSASRPDAMPESETAANAKEGNASETETAESETTRVLITGGKITIVNETGVDADGIDSNGDVIITGGDVRVFLLGTGTNNAIDYGSESGGTATISGGTLIASGSSNMSESFSASSEQASIMYNISAGAEAGTAVTLKNADGTVLLSETIPCSFTSIILSCPEITVGNSYTLSFNNTEETIAVDEVSASYGDAGSAMSGGWMNFGGRGQREENSGIPSMNEDGTFPEMNENGSLPQMPENGEFPAAPEMNENDGFPEAADSETTSVENGETGSSERPMGPGNGQRPNGGRHEFQNGTPAAAETGGTEEGTVQESAASSEASAEAFRKPDAQMSSDLKNDSFGSQTSVTDAESETAAEPAADPAAVMILTGASVLILLAGILFAKLSKGRHISA